MVSKRLAAAALGAACLAGAADSAVVRYTAEMRGFVLDEGTYHGAKFTATDWNGDRLLEWDELESFWGGVSGGSFGGPSQWHHWSDRTSSFSVRALAPDLSDSSITVLFDVHFCELQWSWGGCYQFSEAVWYTESHNLSDTLPITWTQTLLNVPQTPLPAALPLALVGLGTLGLMARRRKDCRPG